MSLTVTARRIAGDLYRRLAAPAGVRALEQMLGRGLPAQLIPALRFAFTGEMPDAARRASERVEALRASIAARSERFQFVYSPSPLGQVRWPEPLPEGRTAGEGISARELAEGVSVPRRWGVFLQLLSEGFRARTIVETGACVGISGAYLASASTRPRLMTVEGSAGLAEIARATLANITGDALVLHQPFETGLPAALALLGQEKRPVDLAYIDGHHDEQATLHYVREVMPHLGSSAAVVLDDILLYTEMWRAWQAITATYGFVAAINVGRFGVLVWNGSPATSTAPYDLARYTGWWRVGRSRQHSLREGAPG